MLEVAYVRPINTKSDGGRGMLTWEPGGASRLHGGRGMIAKSALLQMIEGLPDEIDVDDLMYDLFVLEKLAKADRALHEQRFVSHEEVGRRMRTWLK